MLDSSMKRGISLRVLGIRYVWQQDQSENKIMFGSWTWKKQLRNQPDRTLFVNYFLMFLLDWSFDQIIGLKSVCLIFSWSDKLVNWVTDLLSNWYMKWLIESRLIDRSTGRMIHSLIHSLIGWSINGWIDWVTVLLMSSSVFQIYMKFFNSFISSFSPRFLILATRQSQPLLPNLSSNFFFYLVDIFSYSANSIPVLT